MDTYNKFSCFIVGEGTLLIQCAEILLDRGHTIYGLISSDVAVHHWAQERKILSLDPKHHNIVTLLSQYAFDYLFSIVNTYILPKETLELPRQGAINYHDAPLPKYAGSYATSWAIMQGEKVHGVTWHIMAERVDAGDILKQRFFEIVEKETAFTLNARCYDAAISSFSELIDELADNRISTKKQNLDERTFFARSKRPSPGCILSWNYPAHQISAFARALDFGPYPNPMGQPKLAIGSDWIILAGIEVINALPNVPSGTVTHIDADSIRVSTLAGEIALRKLLTIDGQLLPIADFVATFGLYRGYQFKELDQEIAARITAYQTSIVQYETFWTKKLEAYENITLPYAHRKTVDTQTTHSLSVPMSVPEKFLDHLAHHDEAWHSDMLLATFVAYLARLTGIWNFTIGYQDSKLANDVAGLEGLFSAYVPLSVSLEHQQSFVEIFQVVQEQLKLTRQSKTYMRDIMTRYPVLRSKANSQEAHSPSICIELVKTLSDYKPLPGRELTLVIQEDMARCLWVYNAEIFAEESIVEMGHGFTTFLHGIVSNPQQRISDLPLLTEAKQYRLMVEWNANQAAYPMDKCIHQLFEDQVKLTPDAEAVVFGNESLTYRELNHQANQLAHYLQEQGVGPEMQVGLCVERSLKMVVALLGILKAGGAYVPLDPTYPTERLAFMLEDSQISVLVTQQHLLPQLVVPIPKVVCLDADAATLARQREADPVCGATADHLAYVIYTSGSTGKPKGVQIQHRAVVNFLTSMRRQPGLTAEDTWLSVTTLSFDIAALEIFLPLIVGAHVIVASRDLVMNGVALAETLIRSRVTVMQATPVTWSLLLAAGWSGKADLKILCGGEALTQELAQQLLPRSASLWNMYGPTETTIWSTICKIESGDEVVTIGRPIANTQIYLLDAQQQPTPVGVPGELYIGGDGLARGYLNRPELTSERFITHPFSNNVGARLYKTGDLARYRPDGTIEHLGRLDYQVKLRGFRIEPGEIEAVLGKHPAVQGCVVMMREDQQGDKCLVAYIVVTQEPAPATGELRSFLKEQLPEYMVPSAFIFLEAFPLTPNGKVDRRALPTLEAGQREQTNNYVAPHTPAEEMLASIWEQVLHLEQVGIHDDFFALGGNSLHATRIASHLYKDLQVEVSLRYFVEAPTVAQQAEVIAQLRAQDTMSHTGKESIDSRASILAVQTSGTRRPFFYLHGEWEGASLYNWKLMRYLGPEQPFYLLNPYKFDGLSVPPSLEAIAEAHLKTLRTVQSEGPYLLGGYCNGGLIAYEMARQLHMQGQTVEMLLLIDPDAPARHKWVRHIISFIGRWLHIDQERQVDCFLSLQHMYRYLLFVHYRCSQNEKLMSKFEQRDGMSRNSKRCITSLRLSLKALMPEIESLHQNYYNIYDWVASDYEPGIYVDKITFFWTSEESWRQVRWQKVIQAKKGEVEIHTLPGNHITSRTKHFSVLAEHLRTCVSKAQAADELRRQG